MSTPLPLVVGDLYTREGLVIEYGGSIQSGGIVPSKTSNTVFIFTDPSEGAQFGYVYDGFSSDGSVLHYTGAGKDGDQVETGSNSPIVTAAHKGRTLHAFVAVGHVPGRKAKRQRYIGEFILDPDHPFDRMPALDKHDAVRTVIVFRLLPIRTVSDEMRAVVGVSSVTEESRSFLVPTEINSAYFFETNDRLGGAAVRRESRLVEEFISSQQGHGFRRWAITLPAERTRLLTDVYDETDRVLYEAKALSARSDVRMAVGQLYDYRRHVKVTDMRCSLLLPARPSADLRDYLEDVGLGLAFRDGDHFEFEGSDRKALTR